MPDGLVVYRFGAFEFDPKSRSLSRVNLASGGADKPRPARAHRPAAAPTRLPVPQAAILTHLLTNAQTVISKDALVEAGWAGAAVAENAVEQAIHRLRRSTDTTYIETVPSHGYRFAAPVQRAVREVSADSIDARLEPFLTMVQGRAQLETLDRDDIRKVRTKLTAVLRDSPDSPRPHVQRAFACGLAYEASATDERRDTEALHEGITHAERGCELAPSWDEAWSALAFLLGLSGNNTRAAAAAGKAIALNPENWLHPLQLARVTWGQERLQAARRALALQPGLALAHWLRATVFVARSAFDLALDELRLGCTAQDAQADGDAFPAVGLHLLHGLVLAAQGRLDDGAAEIQRELSRIANQESRTTNQESRPASGHVHARVCAANAWCALGAIRLRQQKRSDAEAAFARALAINPWHVAATAALKGEMPSAASGMDAALGRAVVLVRGNRHREAARVFRDGLAQAPAGDAGWILPVEPMLDAMKHRDHWEDTLARVRMRAT